MQLPLIVHVARSRARPSPLPQRDPATCVSTHSRSATAGPFGYSLPVHALNINDHTLCSALSTSWRRYVESDANSNHYTAGPSGAQSRNAAARQSSNHTNTNLFLSSCSTRSHCVTRTNRATTFTRNRNSKTTKSTTTTFLLHS